MHPAQLTPAQAVLWAGQQLSPDAPIYNSAFTFDLHGPLDVRRFSSAFDQLVGECDNMRTVFEYDGREVAQRVLPSRAGTLVVEDWRGSEVELERWVTERSEALLDTSVCCYEARLLRISPGHHLFFLNQHHLTVDAWGVGVQYRRLSELYQEAITGPLPSFTEYRERFKAPEGRRSDYWMQTVDEQVPRLFGRVNTSRNTRAPRRYLTIDGERMQKLEALTRHPDVRHWTRDLAIYNVLMSLTTALVSRISGQRAFNIGTPSANRPTPETQRLPGQLVEMLPLRCEIEPGDRFVDLIKRVRTSTNAFLAASRPGTTRPELAARFNVILNYITASFGRFSETVDCRTKWRSAGHVDPAHQLRLQVHDLDGEGELTVGFDVNTAVIGAVEAERIEKCFFRLLDALLDDPTTTIEDVELFNRDEIEEMLAMGRGKSSDNQSQGVLARIYGRATDCPEAIAVEDGTSSLSYGELMDRSGRLAAFLRARTGREEGVIAIHLPRSADFTVTALACWHAGFTYVPIPADTPRERLEFILGETDCVCMITNALLAAKAEVEGLQIFHVDTDLPHFQRHESAPIAGEDPERIAYVMYTSGSTGRPKGVMISHAALDDYIEYAARTYADGEASVFPLFTSLGFDLTVTSLYTPLTVGGKLIVYPEPPKGSPDLAVVDVFNDDHCTTVKLTPSHLALLGANDLSVSRLRRLIVGGEQLTTTLARRIAEHLPTDCRIVNEYGPTEATVGCVVEVFDAERHTGAAVPIGGPVDNCEVLVVDEHGRLTERGVAGELLVGGPGLAHGYLDRPELTAERFVSHPYAPARNVYRSGDLVRYASDGTLEFIGRGDRQVKWRGFRIELDEIENLLTAHPGIESVAVELVSPSGNGYTTSSKYCKRCGLPSNHPDATFDDEGVCQLCRGYEDYRQKAQDYFRTPDDLLARFDDRPSERGATHDCIMLYSGGKDSTYALGQLVDMGLKVLAFTLDNGYISEQAIANVRRVAGELGVDVHFGRTDAMNEIFVDSLHRHCNVCNGCFKTIYTLSAQLALERKIPYVITGLSRGQLFETRLSEEIFYDMERSGRSIDETILEARKIYHQADDAVKALLDTTAFDSGEVFEKVSFLDFYRYTDATLDEMYAYLDGKLPWKRPTDTGRSTNCLINQVGIHVHKRKRGYNNYAFPYSWDVRLGHKDREAALDEINEEVDEATVSRIMREIGYGGEDSGYDDRQLIAYYTGDASLSPAEFTAHLGSYLPSYSLPQLFVPLAEMPLTTSGKIDRAALVAVDGSVRATAAMEEPEGEIEALLADIWSEVLTQKHIGRHEKFIDLGGHSLTAIRLAARISEAFELEMPLHRVFEFPTIAQQGEFLENTLIALLAENDEE